MKANNKKGFTLIELMIVIAVIALLMLVLIPRIGITKNKAREAGMKENMLLIEGIVQSVIDDYDASDLNAVTNLEARIVADIDRAKVQNQRLRNPVTGGTAVMSAIGDLDNTTMAICDSTDNDDDADGIDGGDKLDAGDNIWKNGLADSAGVIAFGAAVNTSVTPHKLEVTLIPYGTDNNRMAQLEKTISQ